MASANVIGSGSVILTANADQMVAGLDKAAGKVDSWGKRVQQSTANAAEKIGKTGIGEKGRALAGQVGGLGGVGEFLGVGGGVGVMAVAANAVADVAANFESLNRALAESKRLTDEFDKSFGIAATTTKRFDEIKGLKLFSGEDDADRQRAAIDAEVERLNQQRRDIERLRLNPAKDRVESLTGFIHDQVRAIPGIIGRSQQETFDEANRELEEARKAYTAAGEAIKKFSEERKKLSDQMNARGVDLMRKDQARLKSVDDMTKSLKEQAATFGMSAAQAQVWKAEQMGATAQQLAQLRAAANEVDRLAARSENVKKAFRAAFSSNKKDDPIKLAGALESGSAAAFSVVAKHSIAGMAGPGGSAQEIKTVMDRGNRLTEELIAVVKERLAVVSL